MSTNLMPYPPLPADALYHEPLTDHLLSGCQLFLLTRPPTRVTNGGPNFVAYPTVVHLRPPTRVTNGGPSFVAKNTLRQSCSRCPAPRRTAAPSRLRR